MVCWPCARTNRSSPSDGWLVTWPTSGFCKWTSLQAMQYRRLSIKLTKIEKDLRRNLKLPSTSMVPVDAIIANMSFGFWCNLFNQPFDLNRSHNALWPNLLRAVFPNTPKKHPGRAKIRDDLVSIKSFRNKAFHHEPVWNIGRPASVADTIIRRQLAWPVGVN